MKRIVAIGGGELKRGETLPVDAYLAAEAQRSAGERRACALFVPTASHDCMPYYNTFHKVYTGRFGLKTDVALTISRPFDTEKMRAKFARADLIYVGGGNTVFMLQSWKESGLFDCLREAYERGTLIAGLSAGAICWFEEMYSDSVVEGEYAMHPGLGWIKGKISPHYNERMLDFDGIVLYNKYRAWGLENGAALEFADGVPVKTVAGGGKVWLLDGSDGVSVHKTEWNADQTESPAAGHPPA